MSSFFCVTGNCTAGQMTDGKTCKACPLGTYQDKKWQTECKRCGDKMTTSNEGATRKDHCFCKCFWSVRPCVYFETQRGSSRVCVFITSLSLYCD